MKVLIAIDEKVSQLAIKRALEKEKYKADVCNTGEKALEIFKKDKDIRVVILDPELPDMDGITLAKEIRRVSFSRYVYIIVLLSNDRINIYDVMQAGADDYIAEPFNDDIFNFRIKTGIRMLETEDKLVKSQKELLRLVKEDPLTTLLNRRAFLDEAVKQVDRASRENQPVSIIMVDIDEFSQINESYGNSLGDRVLVEFADRLRYGCRPYDIVGRYGGEEFFILLPNTKAANAVKIAKRLRSATTKKYYDMQGYNIKLTASFGVSFIVPDIGPKDRQIDELIKKSEIALDKAKSEGFDKIALNAEE
jgi:two-component system, cell cycle response regulator